MTTAPVVYKVLLLLFRELVDTVLAEPSMGAHYAPLRPCTLHNDKIVKYQFNSILVNVLP